MITGDGRRAAPGTVDPRDYFAPRVAGIPGSPIDSSIGLLQRLEHEVVSLAMGCPAPDAIPAERLAACAARALSEAAAPALNYGPTDGEAALRAEVLSLLRASGYAVGPEELLITAGGTQGLDLACKLMVGKGDLVVVEEPSYTNGTAIISSYEGEFLPVPMDADGLRVDLLDAAIRRAGRSPKLIYTIPNFQNPTGVTLSLERRCALLDLAERHDCLILEDDPYGLLYFDAPAPPSLYQLDGGRGRVLTVHTFSKILAPGLRVGWVLAPPPVIERMVKAKQGMDTCTNVLGQRMIAGFLQAGGLADHLATLRRRYREKKAVMIAALEEAFGSEDVSWTDPDGGFFLWLTLPPGMVAQTLFERALDAGVAFIPGNAFSVEGGQTNALRLCFTFPSPDEIRAGIRRLRSTCDQFGTSSRT